MKRRSGKRRPEPEWPASEYVYFIQCGSQEGPIKVGWTNKPWSRIAALQCGSPYPLGMIAAVPGGRDMEKGLHRRLSKWRRGGEWFHPTPEVISVIRNACAAADHLIWTLDHRKCPQVSYEARPVVMPEPPEDLGDMFWRLLQKSARRILKERRLEQGRPDTGSAPDRAGTG